MFQKKNHHESDHRRADNWDALEEYHFTFGSKVGESPDNPFKPRRFRDIKTGWNLTTPDIAGEGELRTQHKSKTVRSQRHFEAMVQDMINGEWFPNGESIVISRTGMVNDGTHRMAAGHKSGVAFVAYYVCGVPDEFRQTYGKGKPLAASDVLSAYNHLPNANKVAAAARVLINYKHRYMMGCNRLTTRDEIVSCGLQISDTVSKYSSASGSPVFSKRLGHSFVSACFVIADLIDQKMAEELAAAFKDRELYPGTSIHSLSQRFDNLKCPSSIRDNATRMAMLINAMNDHREGQSRKIIAPRDGALTSDNFPVLWGVEPEDLPF
jgi:hypothetical protein